MTLSELCIRRPVMTTLMTASIIALGAFGFRLLGLSAVVMQLGLSRIPDAAALDVQAALTIAQRRLPIEVTIPPSFRKVNPSDFAVLFISLASETLPL